ncbi:peptidylprolyl isomerase [Chryseolinea sp. T2]|uniref:peptidylprolyl isomerase n=1 Tax=Chryseolinea sp. T2 TaxID=3129255 RepID=UPI00307759B2
MLRRLAVVSFCVIFSWHAFAQKSPKNPEPPQSLFKAGGATVTTDEFIYLYKKNHQDKPVEFTRAKIDEYLKLFIDFKLKVEEAKRRGMDTTAAFTKEYNSYRAEVRKPFLPDNTLVDSLTKLTYNRMEEEVRASHILITVKPEATPADTLAAYNRATELRSRLINGLDFGSAAAQYSEDPSAKSNKGDLGYFTALQMVYPFETAAYSLKVGEISNPVRTRFGYHLIRVADRRPAQGEVEVSHIMVRIRESQDNEKAKNIIFSVYEQLQAGVPWNDLCKQYSEDPSTKDLGGKLKPFGTGGMATVPEFERAAFELQKPGDISDPVHTQYGWHIIKLERKIPLASYEALSPTLRNRVTRDERTSVSRTALLAKYQKRFSFQENAGVKESVFNLADSTLTSGKWNPSQTLASQTLFTLRGKSIPVKSFYTYVARNQRSQQQTPRRYIEQLYNSFTEATILDAIEDDIIARDPTFVYLLKEYYEGILLFEIMEKEVWSKASADSVGQQQYYHAHSTQYQAGDRTRAVIYSASSSSGFPGLQELIAAKDERKIQEYAIAQKIRIEAGVFKKDEKELLSKIPWAPGVYTVETKGMYYLAWLKEVLPPGIMPFEEARPAVISDFQSLTEKKWLDQLRKKYPVKVNEKGKQYVIATLESKNSASK